MKASKLNKEYTVNKSQADMYARQGFDIYGDDGQLLQGAAGKTVPYEKYEEMQKKNAALAKETEKLKKKLAEAEKLKQKE